MATTTARITALESDVSEIKAMLRTLVDAQAPAKVTPRKVTPKAVKAPAPAKSRTLVKSNRLEFVKAHPWAQGMSVWAIHQSVRTNKRHTVKAGWVLSTKREAILDAE